MLPIHERYQYLAKFAYSFLDNTANPEILKTDCWNESEGIYPIVNIVNGNFQLIEINEDRIYKAKEKFPDSLIFKGDIRNIPTEFNNKFDLIYDLSTIDHIPDYNKALQNYKKALKSNGILLIVCWHSLSKIEPIDDLWGSYQYYFEYKKFRKYLVKLFDLKIEGNLLEINAKSGFLNFYILKNSKKIKFIKKVGIYIYIAIMQFLGEKRSTSFFEFLKGICLNR
jgi:SAM-dependent methyltransferase